MKFGIYIQRLIRQMQKKIGRAQTYEFIQAHRSSVYRWQKSKEGASLDNFEHICRKYCEVYPDQDLKDVFMQGLMFVVEDRITNKKPQNNDSKEEITE